MIGKVYANYHTGSSQIKMLALCLICTVVYVYLYTNIALKTETVSILVKRAIVVRKILALQSHRKTTNFVMY
jgi:hypothetical protein